MEFLCYLPYINNIELLYKNSNIINKISHEIFLYTMVMIHTFLEESPKASYDVCIQFS